MINQLFTFLIRLPLQSTDLIVINDAAYYAYRFFSVVSRYRLASGPVAVVVNALILICILHILFSGLSAPISVYSPTWWSLVRKPASL